MWSGAEVIILTLEKLNKRLIDSCERNTLTIVRFLGTIICKPEMDQRAMLNLGSSEI